ncbi:hypothetical protein D3C76_1759590 [compost metagenome]
MGIFQRHKRNQQIALGVLRKVLVDRYNMAQRFRINHSIITLLLQSQPEQLPALHRSRDIIRINLQNQVLAALLRLQNLQRLLGISGSHH